MYEVDVTIAGLEQFKARVRIAYSELEANLRAAALESAAAGVKAAQESHPYQDHREPGKSYQTRGAIGLTDTSRAEQPAAGSLSRGFEAFMRWPAPYAGYVDKGTSRSAPYPFTPTAERQAEYALTSYVERALANFRHSMGG
jgi:hypothetical protein